MTFRSSSARVSGRRGLSAIRAANDLAFAHDDRCTVATRANENLVEHSTSQTTKSARPRASTTPRSNAPQAVAAWRVMPDERFLIGVNRNSRVAERPRASSEALGAEPGLQSLAIAIDVRCLRSAAIGGSFVSPRCKNAVGIRTATVPLALIARTSSSVAILEVIARQRPIARRQLGRTDVRQLLRMHPQRQSSVLARRRTAALLAPHRMRSARRRRRPHRRALPRAAPATSCDSLHRCTRRAPREFARHRMRGKKRRADGHRIARAQRRRDAQHLALVLERETVSPI